MHPRARRLLLLDSHEIYRRGLRSVLSEAHDLTVVADSADLASGVDLVATERAHVAVVGIRPHEHVLVERLAELRAAYPSLGLLVLGRRGDHHAVMAEAMRAGANGYLTTDASAEELLSAVRSVAEGRHVLGADHAIRLARHTRGHGDGEATEATLPRLTPQERRILSLIGEGLTNKQIAERLVVAEKTVRNHVTRLLAKLGVTRRTQAALLAARLEGARRTGHQLG